MSFKKFLSVFLIFALAGATAVSAQAAALSPPDVVSESYCVMDSRTGQVLIQKNMDKTEYPASITKILSAALALERCDPADRYTFSKAAATYDLTGTHLAFVEGEEVSVEDLLCGMMLASANDAAQGLAEAAADSVGAFVELMNEKAAELGAVNSHFTNPSGYHDTALVSTAHDMALITKWALTVEGFRDYFGRWDYVIGPTNIKDESRNLGTYHSMIVGPENNPVFGYEGATGGKLGWTPEATHTIVTVANRDGVELICVAMKSKNQYAKYKDSIALFDYCFDNFAYVSVPLAGFDKAIPVLDENGGDAGTLAVSAPEVKVLLPKGSTAAAVAVTGSLPESVGPDGSREFSVTLSLAAPSSAQESELLTVALTAGYTEEGAAASATTDATAKREDMPLWAVVLMWALAALMLLAAAVLIIRAYNLRRYAKRRRIRRG